MEYIIFYRFIYFIVYGINFIIIIIKDPYNNDIFEVIKKAGTKYIILNFLLEAILFHFLRMLLTLIILEYFSLNHALISNLLYKIVISLYQCIINKILNKLLFLIPAFFQITSLLFYLEILEFNFCNPNKNTKRNIMLREKEEMLLRNDSIISDIEIDKDLIIKNQEEKEKEELESIDIQDDSKEKKINENYNLTKSNIDINFFSIKKFICFLLLVYNDLIEKYNIGYNLSNCNIIKNKLIIIKIKFK